MADHFHLPAQPRELTGSAQMRRERNLAGSVPGVVYGAHKETMLISLNHNVLLHTLSIEAVHAQVIDLDIDGKKTPVILKAIQRHPYLPKIFHVDFLRIHAGRKIALKVPLHFTGEDLCPGIQEGGVAQHLLKEVEVHCVPAKLPEFLNVDLQNLSMDQTLHLSDLKLPRGVTLTALEATPARDEPVVAIHRPAVEPEPEDTAVTTTDAAASADSEADKQPNTDTESGES